MDIEGPILFAIIEQLSDGIGLANQDGFVILWNHSAEQKTGLAREDVIGLPLADLMQMLPADGDGNPIPYSAFSLPEVMTFMIK